MFGDLRSRLSAWFEFDPPLGVAGPTAWLDYDDSTVEAMVVVLCACPADKRLDSLAALCKFYERGQADD